MAGSPAASTKRTAVAEITAVPSTGCGVCKGWYCAETSSFGYTRRWPSDGVAFCVKPLAITPSKTAVLKPVSRRLNGSVSPPPCEASWTMTVSRDCGVLRLWSTTRTRTLSPAAYPAVSRP